MERPNTRGTVIHVQYTHYNNHASVVYRLVAVFCVAQQSIRIIFASLLYNSQIPTYCNNNNKKNHTLIILTPFQG